MKCKLLCVLLWLCATGVSAQHLTVKNYQKKTPPPSMVKIAENMYCDQAHITNVDWLEYLYWLEQIYGKESAEYQATTLKLGMAFPASRSGGSLSKSVSLRPQIVTKR